MRTNKTSILADSTMESYQRIFDVVKWMKVHPGVLQER